MLLPSASRFPGGPQAGTSQNAHSLGKTLQVPICEQTSNSRTTGRAPSPAQRKSRCFQKANVLISSYLLATWELQTQQVPKPKSLSFYSLPLPKSSVVPSNLRHHYPFRHLGFQSWSPSSSSSYVHSFCCHFQNLSALPSPHLSSDLWHLSPRVGITWYQLWRTLALEPL